MAGLFGSTIGTICVLAVSSPYNDACNHAVDAGTRQSGWRQTVDSAEDKVNEIVTVKATKITKSVAGEEGLTVIGTGGFIYKTVKSQSLSFRLPTLGICDSASNNITPTYYGLTLNWNLRLK
jgi:hypothetical protein